MKNVELLKANGVNIDKSLELFGTMEMYDQTLETFINDIGERLKRIKTAKESSDMANYAIEVHSLKSDAKYFGFEKLADICYQQEIESKNNNMFYITDHYNELIAEVERMMRVVYGYLGKSIDHMIKPKVVPHKDKTILVVDDSNVTRGFVQKIFSDLYNVEIATNGDEAIDIINDSNKKIVAVLLDINMPGSNGFDVLEYFKKNNLFSTIPVSIITSEVGKEIRKSLFYYPIVDILTKPFNEHDVRLVLDKTIYFNDQL